MTPRVLRAVQLAVVVGAGAACPALPDAAADAGGSDAGDAAPATDFGFVYVVDEPKFGFTTAGAVFRRGQPRAFDCEESTVAGCTVLRCGDALDTTPVSAGDVDVDGATSTIALRFVNGAYTSVDQVPLFSGGEALTATGEGDDAPAFTLAVTAPRIVSITQPAWPAAGGTLAVTRADGLHVEWELDLTSPQTDGDVVVVFNTDDQSTEVRCAFLAPVDEGTRAGAGEVPAAALLELPAGDGFVDIEITDRDDVRAGTWAIRMEATTHAVVGGDAAVASIRLE